MRVNPGASQNVTNTQTEGLKKSEQTTKADRARMIEQVKKNDGTSPSARADISDKGKEFAKVHSAASAAPDVREERVAELKRRIASGEYQLDGDAVADKMIKEHMSM